MSLKMFAAYTHIPRIIYYNYMGIYNIKVNISFFIYFNIFFKYLFICMLKIYLNLKIRSIQMYFL